jgi:predicted permease
MLQDIRFALRLLRKTPVLSGAIVLTLALGIGLDAGVFNLIDGVLFRPRVEHDPDAFVQVAVEYSGPNAPARAGLPYVSVEDFNSFRSQTRSLEEMAAWAPAGVTVETGEGASARHVALLVTCNFFHVYGPERPLRGRVFRADECSNSDVSAVAVIGEDVWRTQYGSDPNIVGARLLVNRQPVTIVGVMPSGYAGQLRGPVWLPFTVEQQIFGGRDLVRDSATPWLVMVARLASGMSRERAAAELNLIAAQQDRQVPGRRTAIVLTKGALIDLPDMRGMAYWIVPLVMGSLSLVLFLACGNVTMLLLSRAAARRHEIAVRLSLGASRAQLLRMLLIETLLLAAAASAPAVWLVYALPRVVRASIPTMPSYPFHVDGAVLTYLVGIALLAGVLAGVAPAIEALKQDVVGALHGDETIASRGSRTRDTLVAAQVAVCLVLLVGAGVFVRAEYRMVHDSPSYDGDHILLAVPRTSAALAVSPSAASLYQTLDDRVRSIGGVRSVAFASAPPIVRDEIGDVSAAVRLVSASAGATVAATRNVVSPEFFATLGLSILHGRLFQANDAETALPSVIVSQSLARALGHTPNPIGELVETAPGRTGQIVGVAADVRDTAARTSEARVVYEVRPVQAVGGALLVRFDGESRDIARSIRDAAVALNPDLLVEPRTLTAIREELSVKFARIVRMVLFLGVVAVLLAVIGIYAVVAFAVSRRTREMGIRSALGASRADLVRLVLTSSTRPVVIGVVIGAAAAALAAPAITRVFANAPVPVDAHDPVAYVSVAALLALVAVTAMLRPAWRAAHADPIDALRRD